MKTQYERGSALTIILAVLLVVAVGALAMEKGWVGGKSYKASSESQEASEDNPVVAKVDGKDITRGDVIALINTMPDQIKQLPVEQLFTIAIEQMINNKVVDSLASKSSIRKDDEVQELIAQAAEQIIRTKYIEKAVDERVTEDLLQQRYKAYVDNFPKIEEIKVAHILVEKEADAKKLIGELNGGADFAELAKANSQDNTAENGGELGYFSKTDVVPEFSEAAFKLEPGTFTKAPVKTDFGYHIIRVDDKRMRPPAEFEQAKPFIRQEVERGLLSEVITDLRSGFEIERFDINGNPLPQNQSPAAGAAPEAGEPAPEEAQPVEGTVE
ncbi:MAG: rotamase [Alphaproteobacteria bacterium]|nr:rotamase [Alphaproteobacteria bacterium]